MTPEVLALLTGTATTDKNENAFVFLDGSGQHMATVYPKVNAVPVFEALAKSCGCTFSKKDPNYKAEEATFDVKLPA